MTEIQLFGSVADRVNRWFLRWFLALGTYIGGVYALLKPFGRDDYFFAVAAGGAAAMLLIACIWIATDPKQTVLGQTSSLFSPRMSGAATVAAPLVILIGAVAVIKLIPSPPAPPLADLETFFRNLDAARHEMTDDRDVRVTIYRRYLAARKRAGAAFWNDVNVATAVPTADVIDHNMRLAPAVQPRLLPPSLAGEPPWARDAALKSNLAVVLEHVQKADAVAADLHNRLTQEAAATFPNAQLLNENLCRYWELVLGTHETYLTADDRGAFPTAERALRAWLARAKQGGH